MSTHFGGGWNLQEDSLDAQHRWRSVGRGLSCRKSQGDACMNREARRSCRSTTNRGNGRGERGLLRDIKSGGGDRGQLSVFRTKGHTMRLQIKLCVVHSQGYRASRALYAPHASTALSNAGTYRLQYCRGCIACGQHVRCQKLVSRWGGNLRIAAVRIK